MIYDFKNISAVSVVDLSESLVNKIKSQRLEKNRSSSKKIDESSFNQTLLIRLDKDSKENVLKCIKTLEERDDILCASPNFIYTMDRVPNDTAYLNDSQWAIDAINLPNAWEFTIGSSDVTVGVIDTGISGTHPDLINKINTILSKDFTGGTSPFVDPDGHGTRIAGIIGAQTNNANGMAGVCWNVQIVSLKTATYNAVKDTYESNSANLYSAIQHAIMKDIDVLNYSYSGGSYDYHVSKALTDYNGVFVCTAGNSGVYIGDNQNYPPCYNKSNMICVGSSDKYDNLSSFSNYSSQYVNLVAPGEEIYTTDIGNSYYVVDGTSYAAPYVAGVAALLKSKYSDLNAEGIKYYITTYVDNITSLNGKVSSGGRLNAYKALNAVKQYTVKYNANGGTGTMANTSVIYGNPTSLRSNQYTNNGLPFKGWYAKRSSDNKWCYTNGTNTVWYAEGSQPDGYYKYLFTDGQTVFDTSAVKGDTVTMYAQWIDIEYTIAFNGNGGTGTMQNMSVQYGVYEEVSPNSFVRAGCTFDFWYAKNADGKVYCSKPGPYSGWFPINQREAGFFTKMICDEESVHLFEDVSDGDVITLYAYWLPNSGELGDVDNDGYITIEDATIIQRCISGSTTLSSEEKLRADINFDGNVTIKDASSIQKYVAGIIDILI